MTIHLVSETGREECDLSFAREVKEKSLSNLERCYQCIACSAGCPVASEMDYPPSQLIRMALLGLKDRVLDSKTIWLCLSCETCATRCPNDIDIIRFMDTLRVITLDEKRPQGTKIPLFHATFLSGVKNFGRVYELGMIIQYLIASGNILKIRPMIRDALLGVNMFVRGKLAILPDKIKGMSDIKRIFRITERG